MHKILQSFLDKNVDPVAILVRMALSTEIELIHFSNLSSRDPNCQINIQLFLQQFEKFNVYCITN